MIDNKMFDNKKTSKIVLNYTLLTLFSVSIKRYFPIITAINN